MSGNPFFISLLSCIAHLDHTLAESEGRGPGDLDGVFDTLMRRTTFGVHPQRTLDRLAVLGRCGCSVAGGKHTVGVQA